MMLKSSAYHLGSPISVSKATREFDFDIAKSENEFAQLLVIAVGLPFVFQAFINMGVAVQVFPVTGQTLPLISSGGTSIWMTCISLGILQSVKANREKDQLEERIQEIDEEAENPLEIMSETV